MSRPSALSAAIPVSRAAAWLNTTIRPAWSATTIPSGTSSAQSVTPGAATWPASPLAREAGARSGRILSTRPPPPVRPRGFSSAE